jgi:hypothetical protein
MSKIEKRVEWLIKHKSAIERSRTAVIPSKRGGSNAATWKGMSGGGWGWWAQALRKAGIRSNIMNYWSGSAPTASTAINAGIANYIYKNAPKELL